jgi:transposase
MSDTLFPVEPADAASSATDATPAGAARYDAANRAQVELFPCDLESLLPEGHAARLVWRFVEGLELSAFYAAIRAREGHPGRPPIDPKILIALWLYATIDGVGSARAVDRLCAQHDAYRWIRGGVPVNYHTLSDFRVAHQAALDALLTQSIAALLHRGIVTLARVAHDGTRVRASAGAGSFRRGPTLQECLATARKQVERTERQADAPTPTAQEAAQQRAARERLARVDEALAVLPEVEAIKARQGKKAKSAPRVSTTDPDARVMKMADGGYRPAYNIHFASDVAGRGIVGVQVSNVGSDRGLLTPMLTEIERRTGRRLATYLVDGGFVNHAAIQAAAARGIAVYAPTETPKTDRAPDTPARHDTPAVAAWRAKMATAEAKQILKARGATAEWVNADARTHRTLNGIPVRGLTKVHTWALWAALAHNMLRLTGIVPHLMT